MRHQRIDRLTVSPAREKNDTGADREFGPEEGLFLPGAATAGCSPAWCVELLAVSRLQSSAANCSIPIRPRLIRRPSIYYKYWCTIRRMMTPSKAVSAVSRARKNGPLLLLPRRALALALLLSLWFLHSSNNHERGAEAFHTTAAFSSSSLSPSSSSLFATKSSGRADTRDYIRWNNPSELTQQQQPQQPNEKNDASLSSSLDAPAFLTSKFELQTAVTTFQKANQIVELHAQLHLGSPSYFEYYNQPAFRSDKDAILYELLLDETLLQDVDLIRHPNRPRRRRLRPDAPIQASPSDQALAAQYGWVCQADAIDYKCSPHKYNNFFHADLTRQECLKILDQQKGGINVQGTRPLWQVVADWKQPLLPEAAWEAATALLVGPPIFQPSSSSYRRRNATSVSRRIFTNLFLPGNAFAVLLRLVLWVAVPSPELSILLLDWSSRWFVVRNNDDNSSKSPSQTSTTTLSRVALPVLQALAAGRLDQVRQLVFGQVIVSGHHSMNSDGNDTDGDSLLIAQRNDHALALLQDQLARGGTEATHVGQQQQRVALLYGCNHCPDLHAKLCQSGFAPIKQEWRTAWSVQLQQPAVSLSSLFTETTTNESNKNSLANANNSLGLGAGLLLLYLAVGGADWISAWKDVGTAIESNVRDEASVLALFYLAKHVLLYVGLSKLVLDFGSNGSGNSSEM